ncbi:MAG: hypothetical protein HZY76_03645 [Anaerolineae bacterium]|nr:MAG: hypothetical protein HZY76_03645 [Anaerolineae bacterium]
MTSWWKRFVADPIVQTLSQVSWFGFVLTTVLIAAVVNIVTGLFVDIAGPIWAVATLILLAVATLVYANITAYRFRQHLAEGERIIGEKPHPTPRAGLIVLVTRAPTARKAIDYHQRALKHLWLITTPEMREAANVLRTYAEELGVQCHPLDLEQEYEASQCYYLVRHVYEEVAPSLSLARGEIIADMTGGTKPMTAGMALACSDSSPPCSTCPRFVGDGQPTVPLDPIEVLIGEKLIVNR